MKCEEEDKVEMETGQMKKMRRKGGEEGWVEMRRVGWVRKD